MTVEAENTVQCLRQLGLPVNFEALGTYPRRIALSGTKAIVSN